jgi:hypothetical protein
VSRKTTVPPDVESLGPAAVRHYKRMIRDGQSERFAAMCASQTPPGTRGSDRAFMQGRYNNEYMGEMGQKWAGKLVREAREAGINTSGRFYMGGLADKRGHRDPEAWVDSVSDVRRVAKARNLEVHGIIDYVPPEQPPPKRIDIDQGILDENVAAEMKKNPGSKREDVVERVKDRITPHWKKKGRKSCR